MKLAVRWFSRAVTASCLAASVLVGCGGEVDSGGSTGNTGDTNNKADADPFADFSFCPESPPTPGKACSDDSQACAYYGAASHCTSAYQCKSGKWVSAECPR